VIRFSQNLSARDGAIVRDCDVVQRRRSFMRLRDRREASTSSLSLSADPWRHTAPASSGSHPRVGGMSTSIPRRGGAAEDEAVEGRGWSAALGVAAALEPMLTVLPRDGGRVEGGGGRSLEEEPAEGARAIGGADGFEAAATDEAEEYGPVEEEAPAGTFPAATGTDLDVPRASSIQSSEVNPLRGLVPGFGGIEAFPGGGFDITIRNDVC
jgi:hypothetical protein